MDHQTFAQLLGNYGEFVGAIAVVATLGYLALQIRQSNLASQSTAIQTFFESFASINVEPSRDAEFTKLLRKGYTTWDGCTNNEKAQLHLYWNDYMTKLHMGFRLRERRILDETSYRAYEDYLIQSIQTPGVAGVWAGCGPLYPSDFSDRINRRLADTDARPPAVTEVLKYWSSHDD